MSQSGHLNASTQVASDQTVSGAIGSELENERNLTWLLHDVHWTLSRELERTAQMVGLSKSKWRVLAHLSRTDAVSQTALAREMGVEKAPLGRILEKLEEDGLIERRPDPTDRRARLVFATDRISPIADDMIDVVGSVFQKAFKDISASDLKTFQKVLDRIRHNLSD